MLNRAGAEIALHVYHAGLEQQQKLLRFFPTDEQLTRARRFLLDLSELELGYPSLVAIFAAWVSRLYAMPQLKHLEVAWSSPMKEEVAEWFERVGFAHVLKGDEIRPDGGRRTMALAPIALSDKDAPNRTASRIMSLVDGSGMDMTKDAHASAETAVAEIVENVLRHSASAAPAFAAAQVYPLKQHFAFSVADAGVGIEQNFRDALYAPARERLERGEHALRLAVEPLMSTKFGMGHSGYGLFYVSELCRQSRGTFMLTSGADSLVTYEKGDKIEHHGQWHGTIVNVLLRTSNPIDGARVWDRLPPLDEADYLTTIVDEVPAGIMPIMLSKFGDRLFTRDSGRAAREHVLEYPLPVCLSLEGVVVITPSFADELFGGLIRQLGEEQYRESISVAGASSYMRQLVELVIHYALQGLSSLPGLSP